MAGSRPYASWAQTHTCNSAEGDAAARVMALTAGRGVDTAIEAVGVPETFLLCQDIVGPGGIVANIGVHGQVAELHLERLLGAKYCHHKTPGRYGVHTDAAQDRAVQKN